MEHVLVETNWVVDYAAPAHFREPSAVALLERAERGEICLYAPNISFIEARKVIAEKGRFQVRDEVAGVREYLKIRAAGGDLDPAERGRMDALLSQYEAYLNGERRGAHDRMVALAANPALRIFPLDDEMLLRSTRLAMASGVGLQSFDLAVLASALVWAERLGNGRLLSFCEKDSDLQPWLGDKDRSPRPPLADLYDTAGVWVYGDFTMSWPARREGFPP